MFRAQRRRPTARPQTRLHLEALEDRCLLATGAMTTGLNVLQTNLVSDLPGVAQFLDTHLVNPWGISESSGPNGSPFWISDNNSGLATLYNTAGMPQGLVVSIPTPDDPTGNSGAPSGTVFNIAIGKGGFMITDGTHTLPAVFLFATEDGTIIGWNPKVDPTGKFDGPNGVSTHAVIAVDNSKIPTAADGAVYKGLTIATDANGRTLLYASNFRSGAIDVFDTSFKPVTTLPPGAFTDSNLPKGFAPFNVQELNGKIYVTYAQQNADKHDDVAGPGKGFVDVYNLDGSGGQRLISRGALNSPWGLAIAPASFGKLAGSLLVGNFGDGRIHAYNLSTANGARAGAPLGTLVDPDGEPIQIDGLWALKVGNGAAGGDANTVYFTAGLDHERHGLFGSLKPVAPGSAEGDAEAQTVIAAADVFQINFTAVVKDLAMGVDTRTLQQAIRDLDTSLIDLVRAEFRFVADTGDDLAQDGNQVASSSREARKAAERALDAAFVELESLLMVLG